MGESPSSATEAAKPRGPATPQTAIDRPEETRATSIGPPLSSQRPAAGRRAWKMGDCGFQRERTSSKRGEIIEPEPVFVTTNASARASAERGSRKRPRGGNI